MKRLSTLIVGILILGSGTFSFADESQQCDCQGMSKSEIDALAKIRKFYASMPQSLCTISEKKVIGAIEDGQRRFKSGELGKQLGRHNVALVGEMHLYTDLGSRLSMIKEFSISHSKNACVAFEWPKRSGGLDEILNQIRSMKAKAVLDGNDPRQFDRVINYYEPMGSFAKSLGMKSITVDAFDHFEKDQSLDERNIAMKDNIEKSLKDGSCSSVLLFVGKAHLSRSTDSKTRLQELLEHIGIRSTTFNLQMLDEKDVPAQVQTWSECAPPKIVNRSPSVVKNSEFAEDPKLYSSDNPEPAKFKDFDYTVFWQ